MLERQLRPAAIQVGIGKTVRQFARGIDNGGTLPDCSIRRSGRHARGPMIEILYPALRSRRLRR